MTGNVRAEEAGTLAVAVALIVMGIVPAASHAARSEVAVANAEPLIDTVRLSTVDGGRSLDVTVRVDDGNGARDLRSVRVGIDVGASVTLQPVAAHRVDADGTTAVYDATIRDGLWLAQEGWGRLRIVAVDDPGGRASGVVDRDLVDAALGAPGSAPLDVAGTGDGLAFHTVGAELCAGSRCDLTAREAAAIDRWLEIGAWVHRWSPGLIDLAAAAML